MTTKNFRIDFFHGKSASGDIQGVFRQLVGSQPPLLEFKGYGYEVRDIKVIQKASIGVLAKFRTKDIPNIASPGGEERGIDLRNNEGLIEKNHFYYNETSKFLTFQANGHAGKAEVLAFYLSTLAECEIKFDPVVSQEDIRKWITGTSQAKSLEISMALPDPEWYKREKFGFVEHVVRAMSDTNGNRINVTIAAKRGNFLDFSVKELLERFVSSDVGMSRATLLLEDEYGQRHPVNLIARHLSTFKSVMMDGKYPKSLSMYENLLKAYEEHKVTLEEMFGGDA